MQKIILLSIICTVSLATQYVPIQSTYDGVHIGEPSAKVHIEAFFDLLCPYSKSSNTLLNQVLAQTDLTKVRVTYHMFPLPYHFQAYNVATGVRFFEEKFGAAASVLYMNYIFDNQDRISAYTGQNYTQNEIIGQIATSVASYFKQYPQHPFSQEDFANALNNRKYDLQTRSSWKYGCSRGVSGTPLMHVNGVLLDNSSSFGVQEWKTLINSLLEQ